MNWRFWRKETREANSYSDAITLAIQNAAAGTETSYRTAVQETCAGLWARAFASADVKGTTALTKATLADIGRRLCECGEAVYAIEVESGRLHFDTANTWYVTSAGRMWMYEITVSRPSTIRTIHRPADSVLHFRYAADFSEPWRARGPIAGAGASDTAQQRLENSIGNEANRSTGALIPVPDVTGTESLQADIKDLKGKTLLVPSTVGGWDLDAVNTGRSDWNPQRFGPEYTAGVVGIRAQLADGIASSCGIPPALVRGDADATSLRESWRQFLHGTVQPVADLAAEELSMKLERSITLTFDRLFASDLQGRARSFQSMVGGGMEVEKAAMLSGLMGAD